MKKLISLTLTVAAIATLAACANSSPDMIRRSDTQTMSQVQDGVILTVRTVTVDGSQSGVGGVVGGVVGAIAGSAGSGVSGGGWGAGGRARMSRSVRTCL